MILSVTFAFIVLLLPVSIYGIINGHEFNDPTMAILYSIATINPAANFYLYFFSGRLFRNAFFESLPCLSSKRKKKNSRSSKGGKSSVSVSKTGFTDVEKSTSTAGGGG